MIGLLSMTAACSSLKQLIQPPTPQATTGAPAAATAATKPLTQPTAVAAAPAAATAAAKPLTQPTAVAAASSNSIVGLGILSDSNSDEYRADDQRGGEYAATTLNWVELIVALRSVNVGAWGAWGEPRRTGFKYNWSRSSATAHDAIKTNQHTGLAEQVADGEVSHVIIWIGTNDFTTWNGTYEEVYEGNLRGEALQAKIDSIVEDITLAVDTILDAGPAKVLLITLTDRGIDPELLRRFPDESKRRQVSEAILAINTRLHELAAARGIALLDGDALAEALLQRVNQSGMLAVGSEQIKVFGKNDEPHNGRLGDGPGHPGTVLSGLIANEVFIRPFNANFNTELPLLSDEEILHSAGLLDSP
jgi:hypothetical protein